MAHLKQWWSAHLVGHECESGRDTPEHGEVRCAKQQATVALDGRWLCAWCAEADRAAQEPPPDLKLPA